MEHEGEGSDNSRSVRTGKAPHAEARDQLDLLSPEHRDALEWFHERTGEVVPWPEQLPSGLYLVNRAKGIHKPKGWRYALSVRETLSGQYDNKEPEPLPDGSWGITTSRKGLILNTGMRNTPTERWSLA